MFRLKLSLHAVHALLLQAILPLLPDCTLRFCLGLLPHLQTAGPLSSSPSAIVRLHPKSLPKPQVTWNVKTYTEIQPASPTYKEPRKGRISARGVGPLNLFAPLSWSWQNHCHIYLILWFYPINPYFIILSLIVTMHVCPDSLSQATELIVIWFLVKVLRCTKVDI